MDVSARTPLRLAVASGLLDDASMYPPARAPMEAALSLHATASRAPWAVAQGRFLCPAGQLERLADERSLLGITTALEVGAVVGSPADPGAPADLSAVSSAAADLPHRSPGVRIATVEYRPADQSGPGVTAAADQLAQLALRTELDQVALEVVVAGAAPEAIGERVEAVADARDRHGGFVCAKVRCGGLEPSMVPTAEQLGVFLTACAHRDVPFKATAGLHHALAAPGDDHPRHGFLNVLAATAVARRGGAVDDVAAVLAVDDESAVAADDEGLRVGPVQLDVDDIKNVRREGFLSFGTCSFTEPLTDLLRLL